MHSDPAPVICLEGVGKHYDSALPVSQRVVSLLLNKYPDVRTGPNGHWALHPLNLKLVRGEVLGVVGRNGAGKSTLLKLIAGTLSSSCGHVATTGRIAALLELGAGFNPEFTGRENIYFYAGLMGMNAAEVDVHLSDIVNFSGLNAHIDKPVKTYSSGMYVRLAFSIATSVEPDLLIIDEALSVGDGEFASKSFERIMSLRSKGVAIVFCSHSMYQVQALSTKAIWLEGGRVCASGSAIEVITAYEETQTHSGGVEFLGADGTARAIAETSLPDGSAQITGIEVTVDGNAAPPYVALSGQSTVRISVSYNASASVDKVNIATGFVFPDGRIVSSVATHFSNLTQPVPPSGRGAVAVSFAELPLLKGVYWIGAYLFCGKGIHVYDRVHQATKIVVSQNTLEQGFIRLPHTWEVEE